MLENFHSVSFKHVPFFSGSIGNGIVTNGDCQYSCKDNGENGQLKKGDCQYTCEANGSCQSRYSGGGSGSCFPLDFGGECVGIPENCQNCNEVVDCQFGIGTGSGSAGQGICKYDCQSDGGCQVSFKSSKRLYSGDILGFCFPPDYEGGSCTHIPTYCTDCSYKCQGRAGSQFEEEV